MSTKVRFIRTIMPYVEGDVKYIRDDYAKQLKSQGVVEIMQAPSKNTKNRQMKSTGGNETRQQIKQQAKKETDTNPSEAEQVDTDDRQASDYRGNTE